MLFQETINFSMLIKNKISYSQYSSLGTFSSRLHDVVLSIKMDELSVIYDVKVSLKSVDNFGSNFIRQSGFLSPRKTSMEDHIL